MKELVENINETFEAFKTDAERANALERWNIFNDTSDSNKLNFFIILFINIYYLTILFFEIS